MSPRAGRSQKLKPKLAWKTCSAEWTLCPAAGLYPIDFKDRDKRSRDTVSRDGIFLAGERCETSPDQHHYDPRQQHRE